jgi:hypothetical protein
MKVGRVGEDSHVVFGKKFSVAKGRREVFAHFHTVAVKRLSSMRN